MVTVNLDKISDNLGTHARYLLDGKCMLTRVLLLVTWQFMYEFGSYAMFLLSNEIEIKYKKRGAFKKKTENIMNMD